MPMVQVRIMRVLMPHRFVAVPVGMRFGDRAVVAVGVMFVVDMGVFVLERLVGVFVVVALCQVHPEAKGHQQAG
jgi:hypothetical protein